MERIKSNNFSVYKEVPHKINLQRFAKKPLFPKDISLVVRELLQANGEISTKRLFAEEYSSDQIAAIFRYLVKSMRETHFDNKRANGLSSGNFKEQNNRNIVKRMKTENPKKDKLKLSTIRLIQEKFGVVPNLVLYAALQLQGLTIAEIAREFKTSIYLTTEAIRLYGVTQNELRRKGDKEIIKKARENGNFPYLSERVQTILSLLQDGFSADEIGKKLNPSISATRVRRLRAGAINQLCESEDKPADQRSEKIFIPSVQSNIFDSNFDTIIYMEGEQAGALRQSEAKANNVNYTPLRSVKEKAQVKPGKTKQMRLAEASVGIPIEDFLQREYHDKLRTLKEIATDLSKFPGLEATAESHLYLWMRKLGIDMRNVSEARKLLERNLAQKRNKLNVIEDSNLSK